jgi:hypothetical protein
MCPLPSRYPPFHVDDPAVVKLEQEVSAVVLNMHEIVMRSSIFFWTSERFRPSTTSALCDMFVGGQYSFVDFIPQVLRHAPDFIH